MLSVVIWAAVAAWVPHSVAVVSKKSNIVLPLDIFCLGGGVGLGLGHESGLHGARMSWAKSERAGAYHRHHHMAAAGRGFS